MRDMRRPESPTSAPAATAAPTLSSGWARTASVKLTLSIVAAKFRFASATVGLAGIRVVPLASRRGRGAAFLRKPFGKRVQPRRGEQRGRKQRGRGTAEPRRDCGVEGEPAGKSRGEEQKPSEEKQEYTLRQNFSLRAQLAAFGLHELEEAQHGVRNPVHGIPRPLIFPALEELRRYKSDAEGYRKRRSGIFPHFLNDAAQ